MSLPSTVKPGNFQQRIQKQPPQEKAEEKAPIIDLLLLPPGEAAGTYKPDNHERVLAIGIRKDASKEDADKAHTILTEALFNISSAHEFRTNAPWPGKNKERYQERFYCIYNDQPHTLLGHLKTFEKKGLLDEKRYKELESVLVPRSGTIDKSFVEYLLSRKQCEHFIDGAGI